jgi:16S rRNA (cytosine1402-N4)-methyltransferase
MAQEGYSHRPVLLDEAITGLAIQPSGIYIDGTFGRGGHTQAILDCLGIDGRLIAVDKDPEAVKSAHENFGKDKRCKIIHGSFSQIKKIAEQEKIVGQVDGVLLDLGVSSPQLDDANRGFSFLQDGSLDMRMDTTQGISAAEWLAHAKEKEIVDVLRDYGEERFARRIANAIVNERALEPIQTTARLSAIVSKANPRWEKTKHPATRAFQAIRIFINQELDEVKTCLEQVLDVLKVGGRLTVISFHSLEDRIVKQFIRRHSRGDELPAHIPVVFSEARPRLKSLGRAVRATESEIAVNPRSRSAILRIAERLL